MDAKEQIREQIDVADLIQEYLQLKPAGQGAFKAVCPFHSEKSPSFHVSKPKQIWHCFGCDKGGDIFAFIMEIEGIDFVDALKLLAKKAGVELPKYTKGNDDNKSRQKDINEFAQKIYVKFLKSDSGKIARDYLKSREFDKDIIEKFGFGFSPKSWTSLIEIARKKHIGADELIEAGLASKGKRGAIDKFRNRLMIPLKDHHGNTVGFTARVLDENDNPKYMNSPQTKVYDKGAILYGLNLAKTAIKQKGEVIIVEGNLDVVASHKAGVENVVASSGTALTDRQINLLKRYTTTLIFSFDTDNAGFQAARRGMRLASSMGADVRVAQIPPESGKDPDDIVRKDPEAWVKIATNHVDKMDFLFNKLVAKIDPRDVKQKKLAGKEFLPEISALSDTIEKEHWLKKFANFLDIDINVVRQYINSNNQQRHQQQQQRAKQANIQENTAKKLPEVQDDTLLNSIFEIAISKRELAKIVLENIEITEITHDWYTSLYTAIDFVYNSPNTQSSKKSFFETLRTYLLEQEATTTRFNRLALQQNIGTTDQVSIKDATTELKLLIDQLKLRSKKEQRRIILADLRRAEQSGDDKKVKDLMRRYQTLL